MYVHFYREAQHALLELALRIADELKVAKPKRLPSSNDLTLADIESSRRSS